MRRSSQMPTTITIDHHSDQNLESPNSSSSHSASRSDSFTDEDSGSYDLSDQLGDETWEEIEPSESASRPRASSYRTRESQPPSRPTRRHTNERPPAHRQPRVHRPVHRPPSSVDPDDFPGYGRGYPQPGGYGAPMPRSGYAASSYSAAPPAGPFAPPFGAPGALTHYGPQGNYGQYTPSNPFLPQPPQGPPPGGANYFNGAHHAMSTHGGPAPSPYGGHEMMQYPPMTGYPPQGMYSGYPPPGMSPQQMYYPQQWPPSDHSATGDPEVEKKLLAFEEAMKNQKIENEKAQKEIAARDAADAAAKQNAEAAALAAAKAAEEKAAWEKRLTDEKKEAQKQGAENEKKRIEAEKKKAEEKAAEEKERADAKAAVAKAEADSKAAIEKAEKERKEAVEKAEKEAKEAVAKAEKEAKEAIEKAVAPKDDKKKPIKFKDAVGRKFSFPFELCATWGGMEELIKQAFMHVDLLGPHVADGHYDLIGPNGEIILPQVWETMIEPDWSITMHMWPMPEKPPPGALPGHHPMDRPGSRHAHRHSGAAGRPPAGPPQSAHRGPPNGWAQAPRAPPGPPGPGAGMRGDPRVMSGGHPPVITVVGSGASRPPKKKSESKGVLSWMAGKPAKPSGKGPKKAEQNACLIM